MSTGRRQFLQGGAIAALGLSATYPVAFAQKTPRSGFADLLRAPDIVTAWTGDNGTGNNERQATSMRGNTWHSDNGVAITLQQQPGAQLITARSPAAPLTRVQLRWRSPAPETLRVLGDAWERSYGDLGWREMIPEQPLPWYFLTFDGHALHGYGVRTGAAALAFWQRDADGVSLWLDLRNGGDGVLLGERTLEAATIVTREGHAEESPFASARAFCRLLSPSPRRLSAPVFGSNDWYYAYGENTEAGILRDAALMHELAPAGHLPFTVIDDGYQDSSRFPDLPGFAAKIRGLGARPGIWVRPLRAPEDAAPSLRLPAARFAHGDSPSFDPTVPEARERVLAVVRQAADWGFELIKHDFSTYELFGQWGAAMGASPTRPGWHFYDRSRTNAEIVLDLYRGIREAAGERPVLSCNAIGHLAAGIFEMQRTGDDVSGRTWERTRRMGTNTLGMRLPQNGTFFTLDADCVAITPDIPWSLTQQWLSVVAQSGSLLLISPDPRSMGSEQRKAVRDAFATAIVANKEAQPLDWMETRTPEHWQSGHRKAAYSWLDASGADPFPV